MSPRTNKKPSEMIKQAIQDEIDHLQKVLDDEPDAIHYDGDDVSYDKKIEILKELKEYIPNDTLKNIIYRLLMDHRYIAVGDKARVIEQVHRTIDSMANRGEF